MKKKNTQYEIIKNRKRNMRFRFHQKGKGFWQNEGK